MPRVASCTCLASGKLLLSLRVRSIMASYLRRQRRGTFWLAAVGALLLLFMCVCVHNQHASDAPSPAELGVTANCCHHFSPEQRHYQLLPRPAVNVRVCLLRRWTAGPSLPHGGREAACDGGPTMVLHRLHVLPVVLHRLLRQHAEDDPRSSVFLVDQLDALRSGSSEKRRKQMSILQNSIGKELVAVSGQ